MESELQAVRKSVKEEIELQVDTKVKGVSAEVNDLCARVVAAEEELKRLSSIVDIPYHPDRSIMIYGLEPDDDL